MAKVIRQEFYKIKRNDVFTVVPLGDVHLGAAACDEKAFRARVDRIAKDDNCYWIGMGDDCDFINVSDKRFDASQLADWITIRELGDIAGAQRDRYLDITESIAHKCLAKVMGNHELMIKKKYERDIYLELVAGIKRRGGISQEQRLAIGYYGWLRLAFYQGKNSSDKTGASIIDFNLHHGFVGGRLAGAKALNMQRWLWTHDADVVIFGHSHNTSAQPEAVESLDRNNNITYKTRKGCYGGTFLRTVNEGGDSTYSEQKGYFPLPLGGCEIRIRPRAEKYEDRVRIIM